MRALLTAMQSGVALRAVAGEIDAVGEKRGAVVASGRGNGLHQAGKARAGHIDWRTRTLWLSGPIVAVTFGTRFRTVGVLVAPLTVLAITVHGEVEFCSLRLLLSELLR